MRRGNQKPANSETLRAALNSPAIYPRTYNTLVKRWEASGTLTGAKVGVAEPAVEEAG